MTGKESRPKTAMLLTAPLAPLNRSDRSSIAQAKQSGNRGSSQKKHCSLGEA